MVCMYIEKIPNRNSPPCILVRQSYRQDGKVHKRTLANITHLPDETIDAIGKLLKGGQIIENFEDDFHIIRSLPYGHILSILSVINDIGLKPIISSSRCKELKLVIAMIVSRIVKPGSKLATARSVSSETCSTALGGLTRYRPPLRNGSLSCDGLAVRAARENRIIVSTETFRGRFFSAL